MSLTASDAEEDAEDAEEVSVDSKLICTLLKSMEDLGLDWSAPEESSLEPTPTHQLPRDVGGFSSPENLPTSLKSVPRPDPFGQHDGGSLYKSHSLYRMARRLLI